MPWIASDKEYTRCKQVRTKILQNFSVQFFVETQKRRLKSIQKYVQDKHIEYSIEYLK